MSFKFTFREITPEDTEILRMLKLQNAKPEDHICCEILRGDGITMKAGTARRMSPSGERTTSRPIPK